MNNILIIFDIITLLISIFITYKSCKKVFSGQLSILNICILLFVLVQVIPITVSWIGDMSKINYYYKYMNLAMTDLKTGIIYDLFCIFTITSLFILSTKSKYKNSNIFNMNIKIKYNKFTSMLCISSFLISIIILIFAVLFSPNPKVYTNFAYFFTHSYSKLSLEYIYHQKIIIYSCYLSFLLMLNSYFFNSKKNKLIYIIPIALLTWINGKRTLFLFSIIGIIIIDYLKTSFNTKKEKRKFIKKVILCLLIFIIYYLVYNNITKKSEFANAYLLYSTYFSRLSNVKISIYDRLYTKSMIDYSFETILHNLIFFVPRSIMPTKPHAYFQHFTPYVFLGVGKLNTNITYAFQVNMWSEFITNAGIIMGSILGILFLYTISKIAERSNNIIVYIFGLIFLVLYNLYGFEHIVQISYLMFIITLLFNMFIKNRKK